MRNDIIPYNPKLKQLARQLRKNSTLAEILFWKAVKGKSMGIEFHRQVPVDEYIIDFYCHELKLAVEIDGSIHWEDSAVAKNDLKRQERLESLGVRFIRLNNMDIKNHLTDVLQFLAWKIEELRNGPPNTSP